uniref:Uncharacterized protein n=1 Tax=Caenorhabditis japonica TaxID=281687 RepID=A0A8R1EKI4_CAEJA
MRSPSLNVLALSRTTRLDVPRLAKNRLIASTHWYVVFWYSFTASFLVQLFNCINFIDMADKFTERVYAVLRYREQVCDVFFVQFYLIGYKALQFLMSGYHGV